MPSTNKCFNIGTAFGREQTEEFSYYLKMNTKSNI